MTNKLLNEVELEWSSVVANNTMNRERKATGINSYEKDIRLNPIDFIRSRQMQARIDWIDLCCGRGNALIEVAKYFQTADGGDKIQLKGIDLVDFFEDQKGLTNLVFEPLNLAKWNPTQQFDLITIVHGLHYVGDKLGLIIKAASVLKPNGLFIGNLDIKNIQIEGCPNPEKVLKSFFKNQQIEYNARTKMVKIVGQKTIQNSFVYCGANDKVGANYTGQPVVDSVYRIA